MRKILLLTAMFAFVLTASAWGADISGKWTLTMWGAGAEESVPVVFNADGENLAVTCSHPAFKEMTGTGTLKGDEISFNLKSSTMEIAFTGKVDGNKMAGEREIKGGGEGRSGGAPEGAAPQGGMPGGDQGGQGPAPDMQGAPGGAQGGASGMPDQGGAQSESSENWTAVRN